MKPNRTSLRCLAALAALLMGASPAPGLAQNRAAQKKLIEFGWDEPDTAFLRKHIAQMETRPFDGVVFHVNYAGRDGRTGNFSWEVWGRRAFTEDDVNAATADLRATKLRRFRDNFLRVNMTPGDVDWFDDFSAVLQNARLAGALARRGKARGILLDTETYQHPVFDYRAQQAAQTRSWEEYSAQVRRRGSELMKALQQGFPGLRVFLTFGYSLPWERCVAVGKPLAECDYGLLAPFLDGMVASAKGGTRLIDGYELAYSFRDPGRFAEAYQHSKKDLLPVVADPQKYLRVFSLSFGIWMDAQWREQGWHIDDPSENVHTPEQLQALVSRALKVADEYVWIYSETPRWWTEPDAATSLLPESYQEVLEHAREWAR